ncbi:ABC transporter substrate-binding protein [Pseudomonas daroniae]|uniref:Putative aliphatic sulfonates-binding protein n=1 Tax=Phytopseudomonas daroniae TaxID=2487519 RepID=A0A4Q9QJ15_9GAMM|nr:MULTISPECIES: ABC transporter substrate-binding protein [Pseudomonas]TBU74883.1 ABC transporter substrate-binding protein [Pseudomonas daroniae]TBU79983.1 ABC transporter substrate-binding protein [Pseudomonas sp. FRB 228]TBU88977.1 ABC transporter substrate-binding protein [Pseudomonas daroniae]
MQTLIRTSIAALLTFSLGACEQTEPPTSSQSANPQSDLSKVVLRVGAPNKIGNRPYLEVAGQLEDVPYRIEWSEFSATPALLEALRGGNIDIGGNGGATGILFEAANNNASGVKVVAAGRPVAAGADETGGAILVRKGAPYRSVSDLKGARVSIMKGTGTQYLLGQALEKNGLNASDIELLHLTNDAALAALLAGHIDAWGTWDPQASVLQSHPDLRLMGWLGSREDTYTIQYASAQALDDPSKRAAIDDFLQRLARSTVWVAAHPQDWAKLSSQLARVDEKVMLQIARKTQTEYGLDTARQDVLQASFQREAEFWHTLGVTDRTPDIDSLFDTGFNPSMIAATEAAKRQLTGARADTPGIRPVAHSDN